LDARQSSKPDSQPERRYTHTVKTFPIFRFGSAIPAGITLAVTTRADNPTQPLGNIPTPELRLARQKIHRLLDPLWQSGRFQRKQVYEHLSRRFGRQYHTAETVNIEEVEMVLKALVEMETL
jgi:hypothetical protein